MTGSVGPQSIHEYFETERLLLRRYYRADAAEVAAAIEESRAELEKWTPDIARHRKLEQVARGLADLERAWSCRRKLVYGMFERGSAKFVGEVGLYTIDWADAVASIGVWLRRSAWGRDFGREGFCALAAEALDELDLCTLQARIHPDNVRSRRLVERSGFELSGTAPGVYAHEGTDQDLVIYRRVRTGPVRPSPAPAATSCPAQDSAHRR